MTFQYFLFCQVLISSLKIIPNIYKIFFSNGNLCKLFLLLIVIVIKDDNKNPRYYVSTSFFKLINTLQNIFTPARYILDLTSYLNFSDDLMQAQNMVNVHVWCGEDLLGVSPIKCVTKLGELFSLLTSATSPYEFLCNTLGMAALHDVDSHLTSAFKENLPKSGFELLHKDIKQDKIKKCNFFCTFFHCHFQLCGNKS